MYGSLKENIKDKQIPEAVASPSNIENFDIESDALPIASEESIKIKNVSSPAAPHGIEHIIDEVELVFSDQEVPPIESKTKTRSKVCHFCGKYVKTLSVHLKSYHGNFKCETCRQTFRTHEELNKHEELHGENQFPCEICKLSYKTALDAALHSREHSGLKLFKCPLCKFTTATKASIKVHIKHHENDYQFHCEICGKGFISKSIYTEHVEGHSGVKRYKCDICDKTFLYNRYLKVHRKLNHKKVLEGVEEINECHVCNRRFSFNKSLVRHLSKIHGIGKDNSVNCPICVKKISNPYNLKMHMRVHTGEKPYVCEVCGKSFSKKMYLNRHYLTHQIGEDDCKISMELE